MQQHVHWYKAVVIEAAVAIEHLLLTAHRGLLTHSPQPNQKLAAKQSDCCNSELRSRADATG